MTEQTSKEKKYLVAIIEGEQCYESSQYEDIVRFVSNHITNWEEVTEEEYKALKWYCESHHTTHRLIIHHDYEPIMAKAISEYIKWVEKEKNRIEKAEALRLKNAQKDAEQTITRKKKRLEKLAAEVGLKLI